jgi:hypothetical protein
VAANRHHALLVDMRRALLAEFGAQAIYRDLVPRARDAALRDVLAGLHGEQAEQIERLRGVMQALGGRAATRSRRRRLLAWLLAAGSPLIGTRLVLRICCEAEATASRWYAQYAEYLALCGEKTASDTCAAMSLFKLRRSRLLEPWAQGSRSAGF